MGTIDAFQRQVWSPQFKQNCFPHRSKMGVLKSFLSTAAEFHADALLFHNDRAGVFNRSRSVAANAHAVGVLDDDLACIHGLGIVLGKDRFIFPLDAILVGRDVDLACW